MSIKLSIITINRNNAEGLRKTIESVVSQTFTDYEYLVIDGGSTDGSVDVIKEYANKITYWVSEPDTGIYNAMNKGIRRAKGEYCLFLNSGDRLCNDRVIEEVFLHGITEDIVCANAIFEKSDLHNDRLIFSPEKIKASDLILNFLPHQAAFVKRSLFEEISYYDETIYVISDWAFFIKALLIYKSSYRKINLFLSICDTTGLSNNPDNNELMDAEFHKVLKILLPEFYEDYVELKQNRNLQEDIRYDLLKKFSKTFVFRILMAIRRRLLRYGIYKINATIKTKLFYLKIKKHDNYNKKQIDLKISNLSKALLVKSDDEKDLIISLTSYGQRVVNSVPYAIYSIFQQTKLPNRIILFLDKKKWNDDNLPKTLKNLKQSGLEIIYCEDIGPHTKLIPALERFPNNVIITLDDDVLYNWKTIEELYVGYLNSDKKSVICHWAALPEKNNNIYIPYNEWKDDKYGNKHSLLSPFGVAGVLYPPNIFDNEIFNKEIIRKYCKQADDIWFWIMEVRCGINISIVEHSSFMLNKNVNNLEQWLENNSNSLYFQNCLHGGNNSQLLDLLNYYHLN